MPDRPVPASVAAGALRGVNAAGAACRYWGRQLREVMAEIDKRYKRRRHVVIVDFGPFDVSASGVST